MHTLFTNAIHAGGEVIYVSKRGTTGRACLGSCFSLCASNTSATFFRQSFLKRHAHLIMGRYCLSSVVSSVCSTRYHRSESGVQRKHRCLSAPHVSFSLRSSPRFSQA